MSSFLHGFFGQFLTNRGKRRQTQRPVESLETRTLLASLVSSKQVSYQDIDGDNVTVTFSKSILTVANVNSIFTFNTGTVDGSNATKQQLQSINLTGVAGAALTSITTAAVRSSVNGGDGFAALGQVNGSGLDLGSVTIDGDLGRILAGDAMTSTQAVGALKVLSMGRYGTLTGAVDLHSQIHGKLQSLTTKTDIREAFVDVTGGGNGDISSITIGGSLIGGAASNSGRIEVTGDIGTVAIARDLVGGAGSSSGSIRADGFLDGVTLGGSILGGGGTDSGGVFSGDDMGLVKVYGSVLGAEGEASGQIFSDTFLSGISIGGSLVGGSGSSSGFVGTNGNIPGVFIGGDIRGGSASGSEDLEESGAVIAGRIGTMTLGGSLVAGTDQTTGAFSQNGVIISDNDIYSLTIKGNVIGNATNVALISARGQFSPSSSSDLAIGKLTVSGRVELGRIWGGVDSSGVPKNADAQIGPVVIGGDWIASDLVAGAVAGADGFFGNADDAKISGAGVKDGAAVSSKISSVVIRGLVHGTPGIALDHFGFVAQTIGSFKVKGGTTTYSLVSGNGNDDLLLVPSLFGGDVRLNEI